MVKIPIELFFFFVGTFSFSYWVDKNDLSSEQNALVTCEDPPGRVKWAVIRKAMFCFGCHMDSNNEENRCHIFILFYLMLLFYQARFYQA